MISGTFGVVFRLGLFALPLYLATSAFADHHEEGGHGGEQASHDDAGHGGDGDAGHGGDHDAGLPAGAEPDLALFTLITFGIFLAVVSSLAWKPITQGLDAREAGIRGDIAKAEEARVKAEQLLAEHQTQIDKVQEEIKEMLDEARRDADVAKGQILQAANEEAERTKQRAMTDIGRARDQALKDIFDASADRVADATEKVLGRGLSGDDERRLIDEALSSLGSKA